MQLQAITDVLPGMFAAVTTFAAANDISLTGGHLYADADPEPFLTNSPAGDGFMGVEGRDISHILMRTQRVQGFIDGYSATTMCRDGDIVGTLVNEFSQSTDPVVRAAVGELVHKSFGKAYAASVASLWMGAAMRFSGKERLMRLSPPIYHSRVEAASRGLWYAEKAGDGGYLAKSVLHHLLSDAAMIRYVNSEKGDAVEKTELDMDETDLAHLFRSVHSALQYLNLGGDVHKLPIESVVAFSWTAGNVISYPADNTNELSSALERFYLLLKKCQEGK